MVVPKSSVWKLPFHSESVRGKLLARWVILTRCTPGTTAAQIAGALIVLGQQDGRDVRV